MNLRSVTNPCTRKRNPKKGYRSVDVGLHEQLSVIEKLSQSDKRCYSIKLLCEIFGVHRSSYKYWCKRDKRISPETAKLHSQVKEVHRQSNGSAGARSVAIMTTNNGYPLSRYLAGNIMKKLDLVSCQLPIHAYKKATQEHVAIPNILGRQFSVTEPDQAWCGDVYLDG